jgi:hypothetical protein
VPSACSSSSHAGLDCHATSVAPPPWPPNKALHQTGTDGIVSAGGRAGMPESEQDDVLEAFRDRADAEGRPTHRSRRAVEDRMNSGPEGAAHLARWADKPVDMRRHSTHSSFGSMP